MLSSESVTQRPEDQRSHMCSTYRGAIRRMKWRCQGIVMSEVLAIDQRHDDDVNIDHDLSLHHRKGR